MIYWISLYNSFVSLHTQRILQVNITNLLLISIQIPQFFSLSIFVSRSNVAITPKTGVGCEATTPNASVSRESTKPKVRVAAQRLMPNPDVSCAKLICTMSVSSAQLMSRTDVYAGNHIRVLNGAKGKIRLWWHLPCRLLAVPPSILNKKC